MNSVQEPKQKKNPLEDILKSFQTALDNIESLKHEHPELYQEQLNKMSENYSTVLKLDNTFGRFVIGMYSFQKRAKRRSNRKPITHARLQSLQNDLADLSRILKI